MTPPVTQRPRTTHEAVTRSLSTSNEDPNPANERPQHSPVGAAGRERTEPVDPLDEFTENAKTQGRVLCNKISAPINVSGSGRGIYRGSTRDQTTVQEESTALRQDGSGERWRLGLSDMNLPIPQPPERELARALGTI